MNGKVKKIRISGAKRAGSDVIPPSSIRQATIRTRNTTTTATMNFTRWIDKEDTVVPFFLL
jgi:hypothetical protein